MSRTAYQAGVRVMQGIKDQFAKFDYTVKSFKDSSSTRKLSGAVDSTAKFRAARIDKLKQSEESLRTVMYLSCWGPN